MRHLQLVLSLLREHTLFAKMSKSAFASKQVDYLGHIISKDGVKADPQKVEAMVQWPIPKNVKELRGFWGLTGYYRRFVKDYGLRMVFGLITILEDKDGFMGGVLICALKSSGM
ncbi:hypothetical protein Tco_1171007, partial [Tanacetum coccineum]